jgi:hypothetical protein
MFAVAAMLSKVGDVILSASGPASLSAARVPSNFHLREIAMSRPINNSGATNQGEFSAVGHASRPWKLLPTEDERSTGARPLPAF